MEAFNSKALKFTTKKAEKKKNLFKYFEKKMAAILKKIKKNKKMIR